jgi:2'-5' RNA ligase
MESTIRLIIINVLPDHLCRLVNKIRKPICKAYGDEWALTYPPHVTLRTGVMAPCNIIDEFKSEFGKMLETCRPFAVKTQKARLINMAYEGESKVFLHYPVIKNAPLVDLNLYLLHYTRFRKSLKRRFNPHVTLFWGKLHSEKVKELGAMVSQGSKGMGLCHEWTLDNISLYVKKGAFWEPYHVYRLA